MRRLGTGILVLGLLSMAPQNESAIGLRVGSLPPPDKPVRTQGKDPNQATAAKKAKPRFTVGKATTYATGPRHEDGFIDYAAALNERLGRGITAATNSNVLLWHALGPRSQGSPLPAEFFHRLGFPRPPERGEYFIDEAQFVQAHLKTQPRLSAD